MHYEIFVPQDKPFSSVRVTLDGADYVVRLEWNMRLGWLLALADQDGDPIFAPKRLLPDWNLLRFVTDDRRPRGRLWAWDTSGTGEPPGYDELGESRRVRLTYTPEADL